MFIIFLIFGLIVGSFLNVVVYRLGVAEDFVFGGSKCPHCQKGIRWYDNIPVISFILLKFQCRDCGKKISWQYPLVEIGTGVLFAFLGQQYFLIGNQETWMTTVYFLGIVSFLVIIFVYDLLYMEIPTIVLWVGIAWTIAFNLFFDAQKGILVGDIFNSAIFSGTLAAFLAFMFFFLLVFLSKETWMGMGDAYLVIFLGLILGWPKILLGLMLAFTIGALVGLALIGFKKKKMKSQIPFAPFLIAGSMIAMFFYDPIINFYFSLVLR